MASAVVYYQIHHPGIGTLCELHAIIVWLKTCSYAFTNRDLRDALLSPSPSDRPPIPEIYKACPYPNNITLRNLTYFWWAPTLVYQPVYPRTDKVRWAFVLKRMCEVGVLAIAIWIASAQYAAPLLQNSLPKMSTLDVVSILERIMKLSTISLFCWLAGFFAFFHSFLNALAEMLRFGDREYYSDWWNASSVRDYWTMWNKPVYHFMRRHVYVPLVGRGMPKTVAQVVVFIFSGVLHELVVGVPTHNVIGVAFLGMVLQLPLIFITDTVQSLLKKGSFISGNATGNIIFWISFCLVGQPLAALLYFFAWQAKYGSVSKGVFA
ncbi:diacylglycerol O-acyltransferase [Lineolata rhizophorae]|uniref:diacylglycerol O-acyltransferase n=1 Tax=Lineolata rhizophorae TaxID=578093 RepID=A0A6A6NYM2_9PEZI|nr:diacylglycerol O-acyltransferase [Lineolata rhizophorae]